MVPAFVNSGLFLSLACPQLKRWDARKSRAANGASELSGPPPSTADGRPVLRVHLSSEADVPSARSALRYAYTGDVQAGSIRKALEVRRQAVNLRIEGCAAACMEIVKAKLAEASNDSSSDTSSSPAGEGDGKSSSAAAAATQPRSCPNAAATESPPPPPVLELFSKSLWPEPAMEPDFADVLASAKPLLVAHFSDVLRTLNTRQLRSQLLALPAVAVEALLESDDFGADNESSVLLMLAVWMEANHGAIDAHTRERLCRQVRLVQLSRPYLCSILPVLALDFETAPAAASTAAPAGPITATTSVSVTTISAITGGSGAAAGAASSSAAAAASGTTSTAVSAAAWFPIRGAEAAFIASLATSQPPLREALVAAGRKVYDMTCPWYSLRRRRQCLPATGLVYHWRIPQRELASALAQLAPGGLSCTAGSFDGGFSFISAAGFEWWPSIEYRHGAGEANLGLYSQMPEALQVPGSRFTGPRPAVAVVAGVDADLSVHNWQQEALVDDGVYFSTAKDIWPVGGGRGANVLALRQQPADAAAATASVVARSSVGVGGGALTGPLAAWSDYLRDGEMAGKLTLLPPAPA
ncbi:hypothetical protein PLESTB_000007800 [Pleodorina starrii]|uniref:BACK domain-containing protein n=1 Tax=Pleodorina starrii TaxID=330485 RepID=A0A9W6B7M3_9CHLO|nr:hypothetical protein PLESTB_000007800 [Pleodorina starrii]GLC75627.1 hypothetical protein PLESTF_001666800 [Pleodorina starrii]